MTTSHQAACAETDLVYAYALDAVPAEEVAAVEAHIARCPACRDELAELRRTIESFGGWPTDVVRPPAPLWERLAKRIADDASPPAAHGPRVAWAEPAWKELASGISCKLLATDTEKERVSMLVRLAPGAEYPAHEHAGIEELHLLQGELWIDERKLYPGDYNRAERGTSDARVWSETGCTCVLITSTRDVLR